MVLRCRDCRSSVEVGDGGTQSWFFPLWDHLFDYHQDLVALGRQSDVEFTGPSGLQGIRVVEGMVGR